MALGNPLTAPDPIPLVKQSIRMGKPIIFVSLNYRLNIFAFGDGTGRKNLALRDQEMAIDFVKQHISGFGGDPVGATPGSRPLPLSVMDD